MKNISLKNVRNKRRRNRSKRDNMFHFECLRMVVFRSSKHISVQIIDDHKGATIVSASSNEKSLQKEISKTKSKIEISATVGKVLAERAINNKVNKVVFDRNGYPYHGRVKAVAEAAREAGLKF